MARASPRGMNRGPVSDPSPPRRMATAAPAIRPDTRLRAPGSPVDSRRRARKANTAIPIMPSPTRANLPFTDISGR